MLLEHDVDAACIETLVPPRRPAAAESWNVSLALAARCIVVVCSTLETLAGNHTSVPFQEEGGIVLGSGTTLQPSPFDRGKLHDCRTQRLSASDPYGIGQGALGNAVDFLSGCSMQFGAATRNTRRSEPQ